MSKRKDIFMIMMFLLIGGLLIGFTVYTVKKEFTKEEVTTKKLISLDLYGYTLSERDTELYKTNFKVLEGILNENPVNY